MLGKVHPESILGRLGEMPDPRSRQGRIYLLVVILGMLLAGALVGRRREPTRDVDAWAQVLASVNGTPLKCLDCPIHPACRLYGMC